MTPSWEPLTFYEWLLSSFYYGFGAENKKRLHGFILIRAVDIDHEIITLCVEEKHQGQGCGKILVKTTQKKMKQGDAMFLEVRKSNVAAQRLYTTSGFKKIGERKAYYTNPTEDAIICQYQNLVAGAGFEPTTFRL